MKDLQIFDDEKKMTVKEVAEALGTAEITIRVKAKELFHEQVTNGKKTMLNQEQVTDTLDMKDVAKILGLPFGRNILFDKLRKRKILMADNQPYQEYFDRGYFRVIERPAGLVVKIKTKKVKK